MPLINTKERTEYNKVKATRTDIDDICSSYIDFENSKYVIVDGLYYGSLLVINYQRDVSDSGKIQSNVLNNTDGMLRYAGYTPNLFKRYIRIFISKIFW